MDRLFTYELPSEFEVQLGSFVSVPFGKGNRETPGFVVELEGFRGREGEIKRVLSVGTSNEVLPKDVFELCCWAKRYYQAPWGEVFQAAVPPAVFKNRKSRSKSVTQAFPPSLKELTEEQQRAVKVIWESTGVTLLEGVTGSGKTEVYLKLARQTLDEGKGVLVMVPEIALTPQLHDRFERALGCEVALWHSAVSDGRRAEDWKRVHSGEVKVVVGARSSVFCPLRDLGLIVVDEEHDSSFKQEDRIRYQARDLAQVRAKICSARCVLGSATPSLETWARAQEGKIGYLKLDRRFSGHTLEVQIEDLCAHPIVEAAGVRTPLTQNTISALRETLERGEQAMVFLNRRGFAAFLLCGDCREVATCPNCSVSLTVHKKRRLLVCHTCGRGEAIWENCQKCQSWNLKEEGTGTESLEDELKVIIPEARVIRLDRDQVTSASRLKTILDTFRSGHANVLVGTQMLVKGHDFPQVTLVIVTLADALFRWPDFRASERAYQVLCQVSGRAGRGDKPGRVIVQTYSPDHPVLQVLEGRVRWQEFMRLELEVREASNYPPFSRVARLRIEGSSQARAHAACSELAQELSKDGIQVLGPSPAFIEKIKNKYRADLLLKSKQIEPLHGAVRLARQLCTTRKHTLIVDLDPSGLG